MATPTPAADGAPPTTGKSPRSPEKSSLSLDRMPDGRPRFQGCSSIRMYNILGKLGEGTFGEVHKARHVQDGRLVALKKILMHNEKDGFPITALREIKLLKMLAHPNVLTLEEMAVEHRKEKKKAYMYMVTPYMDHDLSGLLENPSVHITEPQIKCYMLQLLEGVRYLHDRQILHRDMKAANLLINNRGLLQIADFGLARPYEEAPPLPGRGGGEATRDYTTLVVTRWYRPPELLLQLRKYTTAIDLWGVGCVFGEMFKHRPILAGKSDLHQLHLIFELVGSPTETNMPGWSDLPGFKKEGVSSYGNQRGNLRSTFRPMGANDQALALLSQLLLLDWRKRVNAIDALQHPFFTTDPLPLRPGDIPQFEESHELDRRKFRDQQAALPPAPKGGDVGVGPRAGDWGAGPVNGYPPMHHSHRGPVPPPPPPSHPPPPRNEPNRVPHLRAPPPTGPPRGVAGPPDRRQPAWQRAPPDTSLPPRPPPPGGGGGGPHGGGWAGESSAHHQGWAGEQPPPDNRPRHGPGPPLAHRGNGVPPPPPHAGHKDTYIPSYGNGDGRRERYEGGPPPPGSGEVRRERYEGPPLRHERGRNGEWPGERAWNGEWERGRNGEWAGERARRRSRSPGGAYGKGRPERDRSREAYRR